MERVPVDLRIIKTRKNIREAFIKLRSRNDLEKIRVTELCELALINKTTFYKYYPNIYALSDEIEDETISSIMNNFEHLDSLFSKPESFVKGFYYAFKSHKEFIEILFSERINILIGKIERQLEAHYALDRYPRKDITMSFLLRGASQVLVESKYNEAILLDTVADIAQLIITQMEL